MVHYRIHNRSPPISVVSQSNPVDNPIVSPLTLGIVVAEEDIFPSGRQQRKPPPTFKDLTYSVMSLDGSPPPKDYITSPALIVLPITILSRRSPAVTFV
jgi:hypothetical protein